MRRTATIGAGLSAGLLFASAGIRLDAEALELARLSILGAALGAVVVVDIADRRIPNRIAVPAAAACAVLLAVDHVRPGSLLGGLLVIALMLGLSLAWPPRSGWATSACTAPRPRARRSRGPGTPSRSRSRCGIRRGTRPAIWALRDKSLASPRTFPQRWRSRGGVPMKLSLLRVRSFVVGAASLAALAVLLGHLPARPDLPSSLSSPVTTALLQELAGAAAWLLSALVATLLFISSLRAVVGRRPRQVPRGRGANGASSRPFLSAVSARSPICGVGVRTTLPTHPARAHGVQPRFPAPVTRANGRASGSGHTSKVASRCAMRLDPPPRSAHDLPLEAASAGTPLADAGVPCLPRPPHRRRNDRRARRRTLARRGQRRGTSAALALSQRGPFPAW